MIDSVFRKVLFIEVFRDVMTGYFDRSADHAKELQPLRDAIRTLIRTGDAEKALRTIEETGKNKKIEIADSNYIGSLKFWKRAGYFGQAKQLYDLYLRLGEAAEEIGLSKGHAFFLLRFLTIPDDLEKFQPDLEKLALVPEAPDKLKEKLFRNKLKDQYDFGIRVLKSKLDTYNSDFRKVFELVRKEIHSIAKQEFSGVKFVVGQFWDVWPEGSGLLFEYEVTRRVLCKMLNNLRSDSSDTQSVLTRHDFRVVCIETCRDIMSMYFNTKDKVPRKEDLCRAIETLILIGDPEKAAGHIERQDIERQDIEISELFPARIEKRLVELKEKLESNYGIRRREQILRFLTLFACATDNNKEFDPDEFGYLFEAAIDLIFMTVSPGSGPVSEERS